MSGAAGGVPGGMSGAIRRAAALRELGRVPDALGLLTPLLADHPDDPLLLREVARSMIALRDPRHYEEARRLAAQAAEADPEDPVTLLVLAVSLLTQRFARGVKEARRLALEAVALAPHDPGVLVGAGRILEAVSVVDYSDARRVAEQAVQVAPDDPDALMLLSEVVREGANPVRTSDYDRARELADLAVAADPTNPEAAYLRARQETRASPAERAARYRAVVSLDPHHHEAIEQIDSSLVGPLHTGYVTLWCYVVLQAVLLALGWDWSGVLGWSVMVLVAAVPWLRFVVAWRKAPAGFGGSAGFDPLLVGFVSCAYLALFLFRLSLTSFGGWTALILCAVWLVAAGATYRWRRRRRRRRFGG